MKDRLPALDGLRGFAAMSVVLGHLGLTGLIAKTTPVLPVILTFFSAAHNAVQILFVLSGFLMAFLYPVVPNAALFIKKRYGRIFPIYGTVVIFLWLLTFQVVNSVWWIQILVLIFLALTVYASWKILNTFSKERNIGSIIFYSFVFLQIAVLILNTLISKNFVISGFLKLPEFQYNFITMLGNLTLTTQLVKGIPSMSYVFWSLGAEVLFYILFPFIVVPLIQIAKKQRMVVIILIILALTKILLDLDNLMMSIAALNGLNIARANGFVAGVTIGTIYRQQGKSWNSIKGIISHPIFGIAALGLLILVQLGESIVGLGSIQFMNIFYLITSWLIAVVVLNAIIPHTVTYKIFSTKILMFLGLISYSLYLIHAQVAPWAEGILKIIFPSDGSDLLFDVINIIFFVLLSVAISYFLFKTVEYLYFANKNKPIATTQASMKEKVIPPQTEYRLQGGKYIVIGVIVVLTGLYSGMYSPSLLLHRHLISSQNLIKPEIPLLNNDLKTSFVSKENNLSVIGIDMRYEGSAGLTRVNDKKPAVFVFELFDDKHKKIFTSERNAYEVEGSPRFQFGFPTISDSKNKEYTVKLSQKNGKERDYVVVDSSPTSFITISTIEKSALLKNPFIFIWNRIVFTITNLNYLFLMGFIGVIIYLYRTGLKKKTGK